MKIQVEIKYHYGVEYIYAISPEVAKTLQQLTSKKTISREDVKSLRALGVEVELVNTATI